jgi:hypothetical protein
MKRPVLTAGAYLILASCAYNVDPLATPSYNVVSSYGEKVPGTWLLYVDAKPIDQPVKPEGYACSFHSFPLNLSSPFKSSVRQTLENVIEHIEDVPSPIPRQDVKARGARGIIVVHGDEVRTRLEVLPGFWSAKMDGQVSIVASITVDGSAGRIFGQTFEGQGRSGAEAGFACSGGAKGLADAAAKAMSDVSRKIGEGLTNSDRIRLAKD